MVLYHRRLPKFNYVSPTDLSETLGLIANSGQKDFMLYAGGTDIFPKLKRRAMECPDLLIDLKKVKNMDYIVHNAQKGLRLGALTTIFSIANSEVVMEHFPVLSLAANSVAALQIQNRATLAGNICNASPAADTAPALLTLGANVVCVSLRGERTIPINDFFIGPNRTELRRDEMVREIHVPNLPSRSKGIYLKLSPRRRMDLAVVGVAVVLVAKDHICEDLRIGLGAVAPTPIRARRAEERLLGAEINHDSIKECAQVSSEECMPIDDHRASAYYRRAMVKVLVRRAIEKCLSQ